MSILYIIISYLMGSIPFGFIFSKISGKEILKIGWRKTSGSNVFKNVGAWQGVATGLCDIGKAFLVVFLARNFGLSPFLQVLCGAAAVAGNNWSCFLKFAGGRGIGAFLGVFLALSPKLAGFSVIPFILISLIWNSAVGTIFFLAISLFLSIYFGEFQTVGILTLISLAPIFIKRLSPIGEVFPVHPVRSFLSQKIETSPLGRDLKHGTSNGVREKLALIRNRLIFDNDEPCLDLRIMRIINKLT